ncbi:ribonuclease P [Halorussus salilacus]|uniref:Rpp14/Pop5 family protein n=1 Tax=Halorussus salilacus TaxID=2953750 RepID=UPI0020A1C0EC|nr:Rpp14/Pop5 family protein [Halorussus salilacus]USZ67866.1 ribonuclease P [Halorussus salilacus]
MKHLPKHLQPRWRYLAVVLEAWPDADFDRRDFQRSVWFSAQNLLGDAGSADADLKVLRFDFSEGTGEAIVRARRGHAEEARAALACIDEVNRDPVGLFVAGISGTVRACEEKYLRRAAEFRDERKVVFGDAQRSAVVRGNRLDVPTDGAFAGATELDFE